MNQLAYTILIILYAGNVPQRIKQKADSTINNLLAHNHHEVDKIKHFV